MPCGVLNKDTVPVPSRYPVDPEPPAKVVTVTMSVTDVDCGSWHRNKRYRRSIQKKKENGGEPGGLGEGPLGSHPRTRVAWPLTSPLLYHERGQLCVLLLDVRGLCGQSGGSD